MLVVGAIVGINRDLHRKAAGLRTLALLTTMAILTLGGRIERALERRFWKPGVEARPEDDEH